jgi:DNA helicase-2/ATP-dependent DNA helicase PcrA
VSLRFPTINRSESIPIPDSLIKEILPQGDAHLQEERRLFYVGLTRARDRLYLTSADYYGDAKRPKKPSPFIFESLGHIHPPSSPAPSALINYKKSSPSSPTTYNLPPITYLDYTRIQTFRDCPLHYKAKYLLNLSTPPVAPSVFGNVIHKTLKDYFEGLTRGDSPDVTALLQANWDPAGYGDKKRETLYFTKGKTMLIDYVSSLPKSQPLPLKLEEPFKFELEKGLAIGGKIDRLDLHPDGTLEIIDYKTASAKNQLTEKEADTDLQLSIYALAATRLNYPPFGITPQKLLLTLYYLETHTAVHSTRTPAQLKSAIADILSVKTDIEQSDFACTHSFICTQGKCDYFLLCRDSRR